MQNITCLKDCFKSHTDSATHIFKLRSTKKWITLTKINQKSKVSQLLPVKGENSQPSSKITTASCPKIDLKAKLLLNQKIIESSDKRSSRKSTSPNHYTDSMDLIKSNVRDLSFQPIIIQTRPKSCSLGQRPKIIVPLRPIQFIYSQVPCKTSPAEQAKVKMLVTKKKAEQIKQNLIKPHLISINQEPQQNLKRSSLFQGARNIVSRLKVSRANNDVLTIPFSPKTAQKQINTDIKNFYNNARLCETKNAVIQTNQRVRTEGEEKKQQVNELNLDQIPVSPHTTRNDFYDRFKIGHLLGVGKWAHVYLCQDKKSNSIYAIKQIFKESIESQQSVGLFEKSIDRLMSLNHSKLMNIYSKFVTKDKLCLLVQYCGKTLYSELQQKGRFGLQKLKKYSRDLIEGLVFLHQNQISHGNLNIFQVFINFNQSKLKLPSPYGNRDKSPQKLLKSDIQGLAIIIFEMGYGLVPNLLSISTIYQKERFYQDCETRKGIISFIKTIISMNQQDPVYILLNDFISSLLSWNQNLRLMASQCLKHKFFSLSEKC